MSTELSKRVVYNGTYRGVSFEIINWQIEGYIYGNKDCWNFYLYIGLGRIPNSELAETLWLEPKPNDLLKHATYDYYNCKLINDIEFQGGCTYYSKEGNVDTPKENRTVKIGCDYQHIWNEGHSYTLDDIIRDTKAAIDSFKDIVPDYKFYCGVVGGYWLKSEGLCMPDESNFISNKGVEWYRDNYPNRDVVSEFTNP
jgi:hypothetical protein